MKGVLNIMKPINNLPRKTFFKEQLGDLKSLTTNIKTDLVSAINWLYSLLLNKLGNTDINAIGDGTITGAIDELNSNLSNIKVSASSPLKQVIIRRAFNTSVSYNELKFEISDTEHYLFRIHDNTDQLIVFHYVDGVYTEVWNWTNIQSQMNNIINSCKVVNKVGWLTVTVNGYSLTKHVRICAEFLPNKKCNLRISAYSQEGDAYNDKTHYMFTNFLNMAQVCAAIGVKSLAFEPYQSRVDVVGISSLFGENEEYDVNDMSNNMLTQDGRITRLYYASTGTIEYGNRYACHFVGNIKGLTTVIDIFGATYS